MTRQVFSVFAMSVFLITGLRAAEIKSLQKCEIRSLFYELFKEASLGRDPEQKEIAAWIVQNSEGKFGLIYWPRSVQRNRQDWNGLIPRNMVAQAHVHTVVADPRPSLADRAVARKINTTIYTLHVKGIFRVTPNGKIFKEADALWYKKMDGCRNSAQVPAGQ